MTAKLPYDWASNTNYSAGPDTGSETRTDPASTLNGFIRGVGAAAQHVNFVFNQQGSAARRAWQQMAIGLRAVQQEGLTLTDTLNAFACVQRRQDTPLIAIKADGGFYVSDWSRLHAATALTSAFVTVVDAATNGTRIIVVGFDVTPAAVNDRSDDDGATWAAGGSLGAAVPNAIVYNTSKGRFIVVGQTGEIFTSTNGVAWTTAGDSGTGGARIGVLSNGDMIAVRSTSPIAFNVSSDTGVTWTNTGGTVANATTMGAGCVAGNNGAVVYHCGLVPGGASLQISSSADGITWTTLASLAPPASATFNTQPTLRMCPNTGLLVVSCTTAGGQTVFYASLDGTTWVGPQCLFPVLRTTGLAGGGYTSDAIGVAGGRLLATYEEMLFTSDGIGH